MINLWECEYANKVRLVDNDGIEYIGSAQEVTDIDERSEDEKQEIGITLCINNMPIEFYESDIKSIEVLEPFK